MTSDSTILNQPGSSSERRHERVLEALRDCGVQRAPRFPLLNYVYALAWMLGTTGLVSLLVYGIGQTARWEQQVLAWVVYPPLILISIFVLSRIRNLLLRRAWQSSARSAEEEIKRDRSRRPILYLRSFALDTHLAKPSWTERFLGTRPFANAEQSVTSELRKLGPVIAIGRPGEELPALGAARFYVAHDRWQEKVSLIVQESQLVLWATGETEGLRWELSHLVENLEPSRIVLWAHPSLIGGGIEKRESAWDRFRETLGRIFPKPLPQSLGDARFFTFDQEWNPTPHAAKSWGILVPRHVSALRRALTIPPSQHPLLWLTWDIFRVVLGLAAIVGISNIGVREIARQWDLGVLHAVDFWVGAIAVGAGVAMLTGGIAGLFKRRLTAVLSWSIVPVVAALSWLFISLVASPRYWRPVESDRWKQLTDDPSKVDSYLEIPSRFRRTEAYPIIVESRRKEILQAPEGTEVSYWFDDLIEEMEKRSKSQPSLLSAKESLSELKIMTTHTNNLGDLPPKYFEVWLKALETSKELSESEKSRRARKILGEASYALSDNAETRTIKSRLQALSVNAYPKLVEALKVQVLRSPYDPSYSIRRELEPLLAEVSEHPLSETDLKSVKQSLVELKALIAETSQPQDLPPIYFQSWIKHLESSTELSAREKSERASNLLRELNFAQNLNEEFQSLLDRLHTIASKPEQPSN